MREPWSGARHLERGSRTWELIGDREPCAVVGGVPYYWCALRRIGGWRIYAGPIAAAPHTAELAELERELEELVRRH